MTVRAVLELPIVVRGVPEVVGGHEHLDREVRWVHAAEVPNIPSLLKGGELLLTSGIGISAKRSEQRALAAGLAERGVAALVIGLGSALSEIPAALAEECDRQGLPLIAMHRVVPFVEVTEAVHAELLDTELTLMRHGETLHRRFAAIMLRGGGIPQILDVLAETISNPVVLARADGEIAAIAANGLPNDDVVAAWEMHRRELPSRSQVVTVPVSIGDVHAWGALTAISLRSRLDAFAVVAVERAVTLVGLALLRPDEASLHYVEPSGLVDAVARGALEESGAAARAKALAFTNPVLLPIVVGARNGTRASEDRKRAWAVAWRELQREFSDRRMSLLLRPPGADGQALLVAGLEGDEDRPQVAERIAAMVRLAVERKLGPGGCVICVGPAAHTWSRLGDHLRATAEAVESAHHARPRPWHDIAAPDLDRLLWTLRDVEAIRDFVESRLAPIIDYDRRRHTELLGTLEALCAYGGRKAETARALHLERPSLYYRIARLEELLGEDLTGEDTLLGLHFAVRMRRHLAAQPPSA
jgi:purine catabolism regulator